MSETLRWWLLLTVIGLLMLPLCLAALRRLPDRGYALAKPFGLLLLGFTFWFLNSVRLLPNSAAGIAAAALPLIALSALFVYRERAGFESWFREHWRYVAGVEALFFIAFITAVWLRSTVGDISGTEQPMDLMFLNATMKADHFPPQDPWLSGHTVAYYYFGYLLVGMMGQLAAVPGDVAYNIGLGMIAAMAFVGCAGIVYGLVAMREAAVGGAPGAAAPRPAAPRPARAANSRRRRDAAEAVPVAASATPSRTPAAPFNWRPPVFGIAGGLMLAVMGNLVFLFAFASSYGIGGDGFYDWLDVSGLSADEPRATWYPSSFFKFFGSTRIFPLDDNDFRVITEFPMFSFMLGDLHPHVMALPFVLVVAGLALSLYRSNEPLDITFWLQRPLLLLAAAVLLGGLIFINTWDVATMAIVVLAAAFVSNFTRVRRVTSDLFVQVASFGLPLILLAFVMYLPFVISISGNSQVNGIGAVVTNESLTYAGTRPVHLFLFWGPLFAVVVPFVVSRILPERGRITRAMALFAAAPSVFIVVAWALVFAMQKAGILGGLFPDENLRAGTGGLFGQIGDRGTDWITFIILGACLAAALLALCLELTAREEREEREAALFVHTLAAVALLLILGCEFFFVGDVFTSRMNTVFKLYYQAWLLLAVAGGFALYYLASRWRLSFPRERPYRIAWGASAALLLLGAALYPIGGTMNRARPYNDEGGLTVVGGSLHGLGNKLADERAAFAWLNERSEGQDFVIAEALDDDYSDGGRFSVATGLPAVLGWLGHENQWRDGSCAPCAGRPEDLNTLYTSPDLAAAQQIVEKYGVSFIVVGDLERQKYGAAGLAKFEQLPVAFQSGAVTIYRTGG